MTPAEFDLLTKPSFKFKWFRINKRLLSRSEWELIKRIQIESKSTAIKPTSPTFHSSKYTCHYVC